VTAAGLAAAAGAIAAGLEAVRAALRDRRLNGPARGRGGAAMLAGIGRIALRWAPALGRRPAALAGSRTRVGAAAAGMSAQDVGAFRAGALVVFGTLAVAVLELIGGAGAILPALVMLGLGVVYADVWLRSIDRLRRERIEREAPALLELVAAAVAAGVLLDAALAGARRAATGPLADELDLARANIGLGHPRRAELLDLAERTGSPSLGGLALAVSLSDRLGVPLADALRRAARRARAERLRVVSERAAAAAPRVLLVVVFLLVPAALIPMAAAIGLSVAGTATGP
jgi:Flp pilus assembly protein TadB